jgi:hypothetical protein
VPSPSPACRRALADATARWPRRNKASDGIMGDARHQQRPSDHNLGNAVDITHDPASGCIGSVIAALAIRDPRVTYVIWNRRIYSLARAAEGWRRYNGDNPHTHHCHISIRATSRSDNRAWAWATAGGEAPQIEEPPADEPRRPAGPRPGESTAYPNVPLRMGSRGALVGRVQERLRARGWTIGVDQQFGPETDRIVRQFQRRRGLLDDGIVGRHTWNAIFQP